MASNACGLEYFMIKFEENEDCMNTRSLEGERGFFYTANLRIYITVHNI